jgi:predicted porin
MKMIFRMKPIAFACVAAFALVNTAHAQQSSVDARIAALQQQIEALKAEIGTKADVNQVKAQNASSEPMLSMKPGDDLTFRIGDKAEVQIYGHADVSYDEVSNGLGHAVGATGKNGYQSDISSNLSFFGIRGDRLINDDLKGVFQFETEVFYSATPGASDQAPDGTAQKTGLGSRNSYVGLESARFGAVKLGKTDTPYKASTARMDPFASSIGDYNSIMGNTGGDNRAEFDARLAHSVWYESPTMNGFAVSALLSPGQNRSTDDLEYAAGEPDCTGGNSVGPQNAANGCGDGSFGTAYSTSLSYSAGPLYAVAAYELHKNVNRSGDDLTPGSVGIADESAYKIGVQYKFVTNTIASLIFERMKRDAITSAQDERTRNGAWLALTQKLTAEDDLNFGWAHAYATPGQPAGTPPEVNGETAPTGSVDNAANMYSIGLKHHFDKKSTAYVVASEVKNDKWAHYAMGPGGHGVPTRNLDGDGNPFSGATVKGISVGVTYDF